MFERGCAVFFTRDHSGRLSGGVSEPQAPSHDSVVIWSPRRSRRPQNGRHRTSSFTSSFSLLIGDRQGRGRTAGCPAAPAQIPAGGHSYWGQGRALLLGTDKNDRQEWHLVKASFRSVCGPRAQLTPARGNAAFSLIGDRQIMMRAACHRSCGIWSANSCRVPIPDKQIVSRRALRHPISRALSIQVDARYGVSGAWTPQSRRLTAPHDRNALCSALRGNKERRTCTVRLSIIGA
jgi:hypothetical protein